MVCKSLWWGAVSVLATSSAVTADQRVGTYRHAYCVLWEHRDLQGASLRMPNGDSVSFANANPGSTAWSERPEWNDRVSSMTIDRGCRLDVWEHMEGKGASKTWRGGTRGWMVRYVGGNWNDRISSAMCVCD